MGKILLFHNNAVPDKPRTYKSFLDESLEIIIKQRFFQKIHINDNAGACLMTDTLKKIVNADELIPSNYEFSNNSRDIVITNNLHRIGSDLKIDISYWENVLKRVDKVIQLSFGFALHDGKIAPLEKDLEMLMHKFAERVELAVRTEYDADFLNRYGIKNVRVVGCPSLFYHMDRNFKVVDSGDKVKAVNFNFTTDFANLGISPKDALEIHWKLAVYFMLKHFNGELKVDCTLQKNIIKEISDIQRVLWNYSEIHQFYVDCGRYFYHIEDWINGIKTNNDFSMGTRFHGNIAAILAGVPTLMVNVDKRMMGMNDFFKIPSIDITEFDSDKPIEYYRKLADYSEFNNNYSKAYDNFVDYCKKNGVKLNYPNKER